jgi:hypothetical protein
MAAMSDLLPPWPVFSAFLVASTVLAVTPPRRRPRTGQPEWPIAGAVPFVAPQRVPGRRKLLALEARLSDAPAWPLG